MYFSYLVWKSFGTHTTLLSAAGGIRQVERTERIPKHRKSSRLSIEITVLYGVILYRMVKINKILPSNLSLQFRVEEEKMILQKFGTVYFYQTTKGHVLEHRIRHSQHIREDSDVTSQGVFRRPD
jgi:hypothetical protein